MSVRPFTEYNLLSYFIKCDILHFIDSMIIGGMDLIYFNSILHYSKNFISIWGTFY